MSKENPGGLFPWLASWFKTSIVTVRQSAQNPYLEVAYRRGQLVLNTRLANYSYGELQQVWEDAFQELGVAARQPRTVLILGLGAGGTARWLAAQCPG